MPAHWAGFGTSLIEVKCHVGATVFTLFVLYLYYICTLYICTSVVLQLYFSCTWVVLQLYFSRTNINIWDRFLSSMQLHWAFLFPKVWYSHANRRLRRFTQHIAQQVASFPRRSSMAWCRRNRSRPIPFLDIRISVSSDERPPTLEN